MKLVDDHGQPSFAFYSQVSGAVTNAGNNMERRLSLIQYSLDSSIIPPQFQRRNTGLTYGTGTASSLSLNETNSLPDLAGISADSAQTLSEGILDFKWQALNAKAEIEKFFHYQDEVPGDNTRTRAVIVSLLVLDSNAFVTAGQSGMLDNIRSKFSGPPAARPDLRHWNSVLKSPGFGLDLPPQIRSGIRSFERYILLPNANSE